MTRRRGLIASGIATLVLLLAMSPAEERMQDTGGPGMGAAFDALENACLLLTLGSAGAAFPLLATIFAACKFFLVTAAIAYLLGGLAMRLRDRGPAARTS